MKNLFRFAFIALLIVGLATSAYAVKNNYASNNVVIFGASGGPSGTTPPTEIVKVRYPTQCLLANNSGGNVSSGDVLIWDTNSADGVTVSKDILDAPTDSAAFAGVAVVDILTADSSGTTGQERNWGYMAIKGYCLAKVDTSEAGTGEKLALGGGTLVAAFQTINSGMAGAATSASQDIGVLLSDTTADGLMPVWLRP
jgi:hypothetical protein